jgi:uncharacterized protein YjcR
MAGDGDEDLMTRREVAGKFGVTSEAVRRWARRDSPVLTEVHDAKDKPRYRRAEVNELYESGFRGGPRQDTARGTGPFDGRSDQMECSGEAVMGS